MPPRLAGSEPFPLHVEHFLASSFFSTIEDFRANSPSTKAARSPLDAPVHHWSLVLSAFPSGTGSEGGGDLRRVRMLGPLGISSPGSVGRPFTSLSNPPSWPPRTIQEPSP